MKNIIQEVSDYTFPHDDKAQIYHGLTHENGYVFFNEPMFRSHKPLYNVPYLINDTEEIPRTENIPAWKILTEYDNIQWKSTIVVQRKNGIYVDHFGNQYPSNGSYQQNTLNHTTINPLRWYIKDIESKHDMYIEYIINKYAWIKWKETQNYENIIVCEPQLIAWGDQIRLVSQKIEMVTLHEYLLPYLPHNLKPKLFADFEEFEMLKTCLEEVWKFLSEHNICHGDLHTNNLLFDGKTMVIIDFGMSAIITGKHKIMSRAYQDRQRDKIQQHRDKFNSLSIILPYLLQFEQHNNTLTLATFLKDNWIITQVNYLIEKEKEIAMHYEQQRNNLSLDSAEYTAKFIQYVDNEIGTFIPLSEHPLVYHIYKNSFIEQNSDITTVDEEVKFLKMSKLKELKKTHISFCFSNKWEKMQQQIEHLQFVHIEYQMLPVLPVCLRQTIIQWHGTIIKSNQIKLLGDEYRYCFVT